MAACRSLVSMRCASVLLDASEEVVQAEVGGRQRVAIERTDQFLVHRGGRLEIEEALAGFEGGIRACLVYRTAKPPEQISLLG